MKKIVWLCFTVLCSVSLYAQEPDTTVTRVDSLFTTGLEEVVADLSAAPSDTAVLLRKPAEVSRDYDGGVWWTYDMDGIVLSLDVRYLHQYGRYYRVGVQLVNTTPQALNFDFDAVRMFAGDGRSIKVYTKGEYLRRIRQKQTVRNIGVQIAMIPVYLFALAAAEKLTDFNDDGWHSLGESVAEGIAYGIINGAATIGSDLIASHYEGELRQISEDNVGYLGDYRIAPDHALHGHFYARFDPSAKEVTLELPIGDRTIRIPFLAVGLPEVGKELE